jgi:hypothetical protein
VRDKVRVNEEEVLAAKKEVGTGDEGLVLLMLVLLAARARAKMRPKRMKNETIAAVIMAMETESPAVIVMNK